MKNEPVAWLIQTKTAHQFTFKEPTIIPLDAAVIPLYTHPHPDNLGLAESIIKQQQAEIEALKHWQDTWRPFLKKHFGVCNGFCGEYECKENQSNCVRKV